jgi:exocyst complex component 6
MLTLVDPLNNDEILIEFRPLYEAMHIYECLNKRDEFHDLYEADRRKQMDLLLPSYLPLDDEAQYLNDLLRDVTGFAIIEWATAGKIPNFRTAAEIEGLWDILCARVIDLITESVSRVIEPRILLKVKESVLLFLQTIQVY